ncbi:dienelactone hydrolase family protein [Sphingomonas gilva]|uniref:Dienelactone hydrolase family protein n=1 Tax=Sphingomonas gilva TaxID=2305907 RepID=A0A396RSM5_9SPHN|nr:dienelactone hydrolase family protein [Sphingomonas gilva]RHW17353.1 dienelactone hydrolase family protein [Sphingomonas gilva]
MRHALMALAVIIAAPAAAQDAAPVKVEPVTFLSRDGKTQVKGYLFRSAATPEKNAPAVVMLHGRSGAYSSLSKGKYDATTLSARHKAWGRLLARSGYAALMVDDFGPVGYPGGFKAGTYKDRPAAVDEVVYRPLHAYGALRYLQQRPDVDGTRVALLGWSNGGSATLAAMADDKPGDMKKLGFKAGVSLYPGCGLKRRFAKDGYTSYAPVRVFMGTADEEVSPKLCESLVARSREKGGDIAIRMFDSATHSYDTPTKSRQSVKANAEAKAATEADILAFLDRMLKDPAQ